MRPLKLLLLARATDKLPNEPIKNFHTGLVYRLLAR